MSGKRLVIQQPYFLPWLGYLAKLATTDYLLLLDGAPFRRNHLGRTRLLSSSGSLLWATCPTGASQGTPVCDVPLPSREWIDRLERTLLQSYAGATHLAESRDYVDVVLRVLRSSTTLGNATISLLREARDYFQFSCDFVLESELSLPTDRTDRAFAACAALGASALIVGDGGSLAVHDFTAVRQQQSGIAVQRLAYLDQHPEYRQHQRVRAGLPFAPGLSHLDALLNVGRSAVGELVTSVRCEPVNAP